jgi:asparagine synthase (glutamine-hydrolysing)
LGTHRLEKYAPLMNLPFEQYYYSRTASPFTFFNVNKNFLYTKDFAHVVASGSSVDAVRRYFSQNKVGGQGLINQMLYIDTKTSLPDDLLLKADKMTMANSIELRVPLLDHRLLEFAARLPENLKVHGFTTKYVAKRALRNRVPKAILKRKKAGFPVPYDLWLRTELKTWVKDVLLDRQTLSRGYFDRRCIEDLITENCQSQKHSKEILSLLALELWHRAFLEERRAPTASAVAEAPLPA